MLLNGRAGDLIVSRRGLRQGDPLSPLLFVKIMAVLNTMLDKAAQHGLLLDLGARGLHHRTSIFADDVVTFLRL